MTFRAKNNLKMHYLLPVIFHFCLLSTASEQYSSWERSGPSDRFTYLTKAKVHTNPTFKEAISNKPPNYFRQHHLQNMRQKFEVPEDVFISTKSGPTNHQILGQPVDDVERLILEDLLQQTNNFTAKSKETAGTGESETDNLKNSSNQKSVSTRNPKRNLKTTTNKPPITPTKHQYFTSLEQTITKKSNHTHNSTKPKQSGTKQNQTSRSAKRDKEKTRKETSLRPQPKSKEVMSMADVTSFKHFLADYDEGPLNSKKVIKKNVPIPPLPVPSSTEPYKFLLPDVYSAQIHEVKQVPRPTTKSPRLIKAPSIRHVVKENRPRPSFAVTKRPVLLKKEDQVAAGSYNSEEESDPFYSTFKFPAELQDYDDDEDEDSRVANSRLKTAQYKNKEYDVLDSPAKVKNIFQDIYTSITLPYKFEYGHLRETPYGWEERYEDLDRENNRIRGKVLWVDAKGSRGQHLWDLQ